MTARGWIWTSVFLGVLGLALLAAIRLEGSPPTVLLPGESVLLSSKPAPLKLSLLDAGAGLRHVQAEIAQGDRHWLLVERGFLGGWLRGGAPGTGSGELELLIEPAALGLEDGAAVLQIVARDWSWRNGFSGNEVRSTLRLRIDTRAPVLQIENGLTYVRRGGAAAVTYQVDEPTASDGVRVGETFFAGHPLEAAAAGGQQRRIAIFAIPVDAEENPSIRVEAADAFGNRTERVFPAVVQERSFAQSTITLSDGFLETVVARLAEAENIETSNLVIAFQSINENLRAQNEERIRELIGSPTDTSLWSGAFLQQPGSQVMSRFADQRSYAYEGSEISTATHFGFDLASTAAAPVAASNGGRVLFAGTLGIYGGCVVIDHGWGITSLYGHLSQVDVSAGDEVKRGQTLGLSGATGLAGGDHLHFAILVGTTYVDPREWWDPKWVREHIEARLAAPPP